MYTSNTFLEDAAAAGGGLASTLDLSQAQTFDYLHLMTPVSIFRRRSIKLHTLPSAGVL